MAQSKKTARTPSGRFVGREKELDRIHASLARSPLLTLMGPPGIGKTRLAREYAHAHEYPAWFFCDLTEANDAESVCAAVAHALDMDLTGVRAPAGAIGRKLSARGRVLVVLDNFEQTVHAAPATVGVWLDLAPKARFLVTSRERLTLDAEVVLELEPLGRSSAVRLFALCAQLVRPGYALHEADEASVAMIVRHLDGLPLAIELAAARMAVLSPAQLLERLPQWLDLLKGARRDASARQATLRGAIDWSWNLLSPDEQRVLAQCAVFRGGFTVEAAEAVVHADGARTIDRIQSLREKSLLRALAGADGPLRLGLYESIREYAREKLEASGLGSETRARHAAYYVTRGAALAASVDQYVDADAMRSLRAERENLLSVLQWALAARPPTSESAGLALEAWLALDPVLAMQGVSEAQLAMLDDAIRHADAVAVDPSLVARALLARGDVLRGRARMAESRKDFDRVLVLAGDVGDVRSVGRGHVRLADTELNFGQLESAKDHCNRALGFLRPAGDRRFQAIALAYLGLLEFELGRPNAARPWLEQSLALGRAIGARRAEGRTLAFLGRVEQEEGRFAEAKGDYRRALQILNEIDDRAAAAYVESYLGMLEHEQGAFQPACDHYVHALEVLRQTGDARGESYVLARLGAALTRLGRDEPAREAFDRADAIAHETGDELLVAGAGILRGHLDVLLALLDPAKASEHLDAARARAERSPHELERSVNLRFARRVLIDAIASAGPKQQLLVVGPEARWFQVGTGARVELRRRHAVRLMLLGLVVHPGKALTLDALFAIGWPDERIAATSAANRVYVGLARLKEMGLRDVIQSRDDGYLIDPAIVVVRK